MFVSDDPTGELELTPRGNLGYKLLTTKQNKMLTLEKNHLITYLNNDNERYDK